MTALISDITADELRLYGDLIGQLEELGPLIDIRSVVLPGITRLLRSDFAASFVWCEKSRRYIDGISFNVDTSLTHRYETWFQHNDPMTAQLCAKRTATFVEEVMNRHDLEHSDFYNDFLAREGMHHGINVFSFDGSTQLGDLRIWRSRNRPEFVERDRVLLDAIEPFFRKAMSRCRKGTVGLTSRENDIAQLVARGRTDQEIASILAIGASTVRTHLRRILEKKGYANRAELAASVIGRS